MSWETGKQKLHREFKNINQELLEKEGYLEESEAKILLYKFLKFLVLFKRIMISMVVQLVLVLYLHLVLLALALLEIIILVILTIII